MCRNDVQALLRNNVHYKNEQNNANANVPVENKSNLFLQQTSLPNTASTPTSLLIARLIFNSRDCKNQERQGAHEVSWSLARPFPSTSPFSSPVIFWRAYSNDSFISPVRRGEHFYRARKLVCARRYPSSGRSPMRLPYIREIFPTIARRKRRFEGVKGAVSCAPSSSPTLAR